MTIFNKMYVIKQKNIVVENLRIWTRSILFYCLISPISLFENVNFIN